MGIINNVINKLIKTNIFLGSMETLVLIVNFKKFLLVF